MYHLYRIEDLKLDHIDIIAEHPDHAADIMLAALRDGLERDPGTEFSILSWTPRRIRRFPRLVRWAKEKRHGVVWPSRDGEDWEHIQYELDAR